MRHMIIFRKEAVSVSSSFLNVNAYLVRKVFLLVQRDIKTTDLQSVATKDPKTG